MDPQVDPTRVVGAGDEREERLGAPATGERRPAVDPPPRAGVLVEEDLLAGRDAEDDAVGTPEDRPDRPPIRPGLATIVRVLPGPPERGGVAPVSPQHG